MILEMINAEALREMLSHSPWGRQFLETLFGQPDAFDMHHQVASGVPVEQHGDGVSAGTEASSHSDTFEVADADYAVNFGAPRAPNTNEVSFPEDAKRYLKMLQGYLERDITALENNPRNIVAIDGSAIDPKPYVERYRQLIDLIQDARQRGAPQSVVENYYNEVLKLQKQVWNNGLLA